MAKASSWYAVKTVYRTVARGRPRAREAGYDPKASLVEERVVLFRAASFEDAIREADKEASEYARGRGVYRNPYGQEVETSYLGACDAFEVEADPAHRSEIYSRTEVVSDTESVRRLVERLLGKLEPDDGDPRRRKFVPGPDAPARARRR